MTLGSMSKIRLHHPGIPLSRICRQANRCRYEWGGETDYKAGVHLGERQMGSDRGQ